MYVVFAVRRHKDKNYLANNVHVSRIIFAKVAFFCNKAILAWIFFIYYSD